MYLRKHRKKLVVLISLIIILSFLIIIFYLSKTLPNGSIENAPLWKTKGTIVHQVEDWSDFWGLKISFWDKPFGVRKLRFADLPEEFQKEGLKVKVKYGKHDVIGTSDWDVIIDIVDIQKI